MDIVAVSNGNVLQPASAATGSSGGAVASSSGGGESAISSLADLQKQSPEVYRAMMQGIAIHICDDMKKHQERLKQLMRQYA